MPIGRPNDLRHRGPPLLVSQQMRAARAFHAAASAQVGTPAKGRCRSKSAFAAEALAGPQYGYQFDAWLGVTSTIRSRPTDRSEKVIWLGWLQR